MGGEGRTPLRRASVAQCSQCAEMIRSQMADSYAQCEIPDSGRKSCPRANIPRWRTDCPNRPSCLLLIFPHGEPTRIMILVPVMKFRLTGHAKAHGARVLRGSSGAVRLHFRGLHGTCSEARTCYAGLTKSGIAALHGESTNSSDRREWIRDGLAHGDTRTGVLFTGVRSLVNSSR